MNKTLRQAIQPAVLGLLALTGLLVVWYSTRWGAGLMDDSLLYIMSAKNFAAGRGLVWPWGDGSFKALTAFPPFFPLVLSVFQMAGIDATAAARAFNAAAFGLNLCLVGLLARRAAGSWVWGLLAAVLALLSDVLIEMHAWAMSEPLYLLLQLGGLLALSQYFDSGRRRWLVAGALAFGLAFITRYIGFALVLVGLIALVFNQRQNLRQRLSDSVLYGVIAGLPMTIWMVRTLFLIGSPIDRAPGAYIVTLNQLRKGLNTLLAWFIPGRLVNGSEFMMLAIVLLAAAAVAGLGLWLKRRSQPAAQTGELSARFPTLRQLLALQVALHLVVLLVSKSFFEPTTPLNNRVLGPMLPGLLVLLVAVLADFWRLNRQQLAVRGALALAALLFIGFYAYRSADLAPRLHNSGLGFARKGWHNSPTLEAVRQLPAGPLFSNSPAAVYYWTGRPAYPLWDINQIRSSLRDQNGSLVVFNSISLDLYDTNPEDLTQGLVELASFRDGAIYRATGK